MSMINLLKKYFGICLILIACNALPAVAQLLPNAPMSVGANYYLQNWVVEEGSSKVIASQSVIPIGVLIPVRQGVELRLSTSYANLSSEDQNTGVKNSVSGLTDVKIQTNIGFLAGRMALGIVANIPTGKSELNREERNVISSFVAPDLAVRNSDLGAGLNLGSNLTYVHPISQQLSAGLTVGFLNRGSFDTTLPGGSSVVGFSPGYDASASLGFEYRQRNSSFKILGSFTNFGSESVTNGSSDSEVFKLGSRIGINASYLRSYTRGIFSIGVEDIIRLKNSAVQGGSLSTELLNNNGNYLIAFVQNDYQATDNFVLQLSGIGRFIGANEFDRGDSSLFEVGLNAFVNPNNRVRFGLGGKYFTGGGTSFFSDLERTISGFEGQATINLAF